MKLISITLIASSMVASAPSEKATQFVSQFSNICMVGYGDFEALKQSVKASGFRREPLASPAPRSMRATRMDNIIIYRGDNESSPQCFIQTHRVPGKSVDELASLLQAELGLGEPERSTNCQGRPLWRWRSAHREKNVWILLVDDMLIGDRNVRLSIFPWTDQKADCTSKPTILRVER